MKLEKINFEVFKTNIYKEYIDVFPTKQQKPLKFIQNGISKEIMEILEIIENDKIVGFFILNKIKEDGYFQLDYFAIFKRYQSKGYGSKAIKELIKYCEKSKGIFIEIEKIENAKNEEEKNIRQRRANFYEKLNFQKLDFDIIISKMLFTPYILMISKTEELNQKELIETIMEIYIQISGKEYVQENIEFLNT